MLFAAMTHLPKGVRHCALLTIKLEHSVICLALTWTATQWKDNFILNTLITKKALKVDCDPTGAIHKGTTHCCESFKIL
jgi:hypothetical protein